MEITGIVRGREIKKNRDGSTAKMLLQVEITNPQDIQTVELMRQAGEDTNPPDGSRVLILEVGPSWKIAVASDDNIVPTMAAGEKRIYSTSGGSVVADIKLLADGTIEVNGNSDFAVAFNDLKTGFDQLKSDFNAHTHLAAATAQSIAAGDPPSVPVSLSSASIDASKVDTVKLP